MEELTWMVLGFRSQHRDEFMIAKSKSPLINVIVRGAELLQ